MALGLTLRHRWPRLTERIRKPLGTFSLLALLAFIAAGLVSQRALLNAQILPQLVIVILHNASGLLLGYLCALAFRVAERDRRAIMIEGGMQNSGLALGIIAVQFNADLGMVIIASLWGIWHIVSGLTLAIAVEDRRMLDWLIEGGTRRRRHRRRAVHAPTSASRTAASSRSARIDDAARERVDARGAWVTPGFVDIHTHYDGQATWDETFSPSIHHGVTTVVMGNCGVGFAPVRAGREGELIKLMEGVEDIPGAALAEGIRWGWESFPQYMDALDATPHSLDFLVQVPHDPVRMAVMGERAFTQQAAGADDIAAMRALVREALAGRRGRLQHRPQRQPPHVGRHARRRPPRRPRPSCAASPAPSTASSHGVIQMVSDFDVLKGPERFDAEFDLVEQVARAVRPAALDDLAAARPGRRAVAGDPRARRRGGRRRAAALPAGGGARHRRDPRARRELPSVHGLSRRTRRSRTCRSPSAPPRCAIRRARRACSPRSRTASPATARRFRRWSTSCSRASS